MKKIIFIVFVLIAFACSSDDNSSVNQPEGPMPSDQLIDWVSGNATELGLSLSTDRFRSFQGGSPFPRYDFRLKITPKPGYENISYTVYAIEYTMNSDGAKFYKHDTVGYFDGEFIGIPNTYNITFHMDMSDYMEYDAELLIKGENFTGDPFDWSAQGHERRD